MLANALLAWSAVFRNTQSGNRGTGGLVPEHVRVVLRSAVVFRNKARLLLPSAARVPVQFAPLLWAALSKGCCTSREVFYSFKVAGVGGGKGQRRLGHTGQAEEKPELVCEHE